MVKQEQRVTFALRDVVSLLLICLLTSIGLGVYERWRRRKQTGAAKDLGDDPSRAVRSGDGELAALKQAHAEALAAVQVEHHEEIQALRAQLERAPVATPGAKSSEDSQLIRITQELGLTRGALGASQTSINELREKLTVLTETLRTLEQERAQRHAELIRANERHARAEAELSELRALARQRPANDPLPPAAQTGVGPRPTDSAAGGRAQASEEASSYSVTGGQEERIVIPKRRR
jgi:hypothetical protein